jgi:SAM-dependent methyltransferase
VLEIGPGTGQATVPLAERGCRIVAVELGAGLAAVARRKLARYPRVEVVVAAFEDWPLPPDPFDLVLAATAFHWIDPAVRVAKAADALRPGGALAVISTHHVAGGDHGFFADVQACYRRWDPETTPGFRLPTAAEVPMRGDELDRSGRFGPVAFRRHQWELPTPPPPTWSCCAPTPGTSRWRPRPATACSPASPTSSTAAMAAASPSAT